MQVIGLITGGESTQCQFMCGNNPRRSQKLMIARTPLNSKVVDKYFLDDEEIETLKEAITENPVIFELDGCFKPSTIPIFFLDLFPEKIGSLIDERRSTLFVVVNSGGSANEFWPSETGGMSLIDSVNSILVEKGEEGSLEFARGFNARKKGKNCSDRRAPASARVDTNETSLGFLLTPPIDSGETFNDFWAKLKKCIKGFKGKQDIDFCDFEGEEGEIIQWAGKGISEIVFIVLLKQNEEKFDDVCKFLKELTELRGKSEGGNVRDSIHSSSGEKLMKDDRIESSRPRRDSIQSLRGEKVKERIDSTRSLRGEKTRERVDFARSPRPPLNGTTPQRFNPSTPGLHFTTFAAGEDHSDSSQSPPSTRTRTRPAIASLAAENAALHAALARQAENFDNLGRLLRSRVESTRAASAAAANRRTATVERVAAAENRKLKESLESQAAEIKRLEAAEELIGLLREERATQAAALQASAGEVAEARRLASVAEAQRVAAVEEASEARRLAAAAEAQKVAMIQAMEAETRRLAAVVEASEARRLAAVQAAEAAEVRRQAAIQSAEAAEARRLAAVAEMSSETEARKLALVQAAEAEARRLVSVQAGEAEVKRLMTLLENETRKVENVQAAEIEARNKVEGLLLEISGLQRERERSHVEEARLKGLITHFETKLAKKKLKSASLKAELSALQAKYIGVREDLIEKNTTLKFAKEELIAREEQAKPVRSAMASIAEIKNLVNTFRNMKK